MIEKESESKTEVAAEVKAEEPKGLSRRDALEVAIAVSKDPKLGTVAEPDKPEPVKVEEPVVEKFAAPAEYTPEERADFEQLSRKGQEAQLRLDKSRKSRIEEIKREAADLQWAKDLAKEVEPYLRSVGGKKKAHEALIDALKMRREFDEGDPKAAAAAYLKAKGLEVPKDLLAEISESDEKITPLQDKINALESKIAQREMAEAGSVLGSAWQSFEQEKNAGGESRFPDINETESGLRLSSNIGSLVSGQTELSKQFIANAKSRIPNLTYQALLTEAYRYYGGRINDSEAPRTQATQKHIAKSSRAAASVPGSGAKSGSVIGRKFKTYREAAEAALAEIRETEGA
jgi:hypothetical protein